MSELDVYVIYCTILCNLLKIVTDVLISAIVIS